MSSSKDSIHPFDPTVPKPEVDRLFRKLADTRIPKNPIVPDAGDDYGPPLEWVQKLYDSYLSFSWNDAEKKIGSWSHFTTTIEDLSIHFIHQRAKKSSSKAAIPLLLVHGWPGSFFEFSRVIEPLTNPSSADTPAFDVVVPSMPGFCWSQGPPRGWTLQDNARIFDKLMKRLGYKTYVAQGGDWGHWVMRELGAQFSDSCVALHTNMCPSQPPVPEKEWTDRERHAQKQTDDFLGKPLDEVHMGYAIEMRTRPQTIGIAFSDNPVGIMMFVGEKYNEIVDPEFKNLSSTSPKVKDFVQDILTTCSLYFFTSPSIMTSMLCYYNNVRHEKYVEFNTAKENLIRTPFAFSSFPWDISPVSERSAATTGNLKWFKEHSRGGHFAALEAPEELVEDLRDFFPQWYKS